MTPNGNRRRPYDVLLRAVRTSGSVQELADLRVLALAHCRTRGPAEIDAAVAGRRRELETTASRHDVSWRRHNVVVALGGVRLAPPARRDLHGSGSMHEFDEHQRHDLARDITARLRRVCAHMSATEFDDLVDDLIAMKARFRAIERDTSLWYAIDRDAPGAADPRLGPRWFDREVARPRAPGRQNG